MGGPARAPLYNIVTPLVWFRICSKRSGASNLE
jgi:hypothetical protein